MVTSRCGQRLELVARLIRTAQALFEQRRAAKADPSLVVDDFRERRAAREQRGQRLVVVAGLELAFHDCQRSYVVRVELQELVPAGQSAALIAELAELRGELVQHCG